MKKLYTLIIPFIILISCSKEDNYDDTINDGKIKFSVEVAQPKTKLATDDEFNLEFEIGDMIGIFAYKRPIGGSAAEGEMFINNAKLRYTGRQWALEEDVYYPTGENELDFYAYYPYDKDVTPLNLKYDASIKMHDMLQSKKIGVLSANNLPIRLQFNHVMALVDLHLSKEIEIPDLDNTFKVTMDCVVGGTYNIFAETVDSLVEGQVEMKLITDGTKTRRYRAWIPAQYVPQYTYLFDFTQTTPGKEIELAHKTTQNVKFRNGNVTRYTLQLEDIFNPEHKYKLYDPFPYKGKVEGIVIMIRDEGLSGRVLNLRNKDGIQWSTEYSVTGGKDLYDGLGNMLKVQIINDWINKFPAFAWSESFGRGWHMPALTDAANYFYKDVDRINTELAKYGGDPINRQNTYWTASETNATSARTVDAKTGNTTSSQPKRTLYSARAIMDF